MEGSSNLELLALFHWFGDALFVMMKRMTLENCISGDRLFLTGHSKIQ